MQRFDAKCNEGDPPHNLKDRLATGYCGGGRYVTPIGPRHALCVRHITNNASAAQSICLHDGIWRSLDWVGDISETASLLKIHASDPPFSSWSNIYTGPYTLGLDVIAIGYTPACGWFAWYESGIDLVVPKRSGVGWVEPLQVYTSRDTKKYPNAGQAVGGESSGALFVLNPANSEWELLAEVCWSGVGQVPTNEDFAAIQSIMGSDYVLFTAEAAMEAEIKTYIDSQLAAVLAPIQTGWVGIQSDFAAMKASGSVSPTPMPTLAGFQSSGTAWKYKGVPVAAIAGHPAWLPAPFGSTWMAPAGVDWMNMPPGEYVFELDFQEVAGKVIHFNMAADNRVKQIELDGVISVTPSTGFKALTPASFAASGAPQHIKITLVNDGTSPNPAGLLITLG